MSIKVLQNFYKETVSVAWATGTGNRYVSTKPTVSAGWLVISPANSTLREIVEFNGTGTDGTGDYITVTARGVGGTTEQAHAINEPIRMNYTAQHHQEMADAIVLFNYYIAPVANYAALPAGQVDGAVCVTLDDSKVYVYDSGTATWNLAGAGGGAGTVYITTKMGTEADGDDNRTFSLTTGSFSDDKYLQVFCNGILMENGASADYVTSGGNKAVFNSVVLDTDKITLLVVSVDLYNPAWNSVNSDLLPDTDNTHNIGSATKQFKDLFLKNTTSGTATSASNKVVDAADVSATTAASKIVRANASGKIDNGFLSVSKRFYSDVTATGIGTSPTTLDTISIPANTLGTSNAIKITVITSINDNGNTRNLTLDCAYGSSTALGVVYAKTTTSSLIGNIKYEFILFAAGATGAQVINGSVLGPNSGVSSTTNGFADNAASSITQDSTGALNIVIRGTLSSTSNTSATKVITFAELISA